MKFKNLLLLALIALATQTIAQSNPKLAARIDKLAESTLINIHSEDVFVKTGKSSIGTADYNELKSIVMNNGFPTISMVGESASHKVWLMVQICDHDLQFQMAVLKQMGRSMRKGDVIKEDYAMLTDRTRMNRSIPQLYGTQYVMDYDGNVSLYKMLDYDNVNDRRKMLDMSNLQTAQEKVMATVEEKVKKREIGY